MTLPRPVLVLVLVLALECSARAQDSPREAGQKLREALRAAPPRDALAPNRSPDGPPEGEVRLAAYLGLARVGDVTLHTQLEEKGGEKLYSIEDRLDVDAPGIGNVHVLVVGYLASDLSVRDLALETQAPGPDGSVVSRRLAVAPEDGALWLTETKNDEKPVKKKLEGLDPRALLLTPPLGVGERMTRLAKGEVGSRLSFDGWDLGRGQPGTLAISFEEQAKTDVRGESVSLLRAVRDEGPASLEAWLDPTSREPVKLVRGDATAPRLSFVGREPRERGDLPAPPASARAAEGPRETVLRFVRATGMSDPRAAEPEILACLDVDALLARATAKSGATVERKTFEKALLQRLTSDDWRKNESRRIQTGALKAEDWDAQGSGDAASVRPAGSPDAPAFELRKTDAGWKIVALPER